MSLVNDLNELLAWERSEVEATTDLLKVLQASDGDLTGGVQDIHDAARWACSGLYHTITRLGGSPGLDSGDLRERVEEQPETPEKLKILCNDQETIIARCKTLLKKHSPDSAARELLDEIVRNHQRAIQWCLRAIGQWTP